MTAIFICTHGKAAEAILQSAEMICGKQKNIEYTFFDVDDSPDQLKERIVDKFKKLDRSKGMLCLTDLKGGTPFNVLVNLSRDNEMKIVSGISIPMLLNVLLVRPSMTVEKLAKEAVTSGIESIYQYVPETVNESDIDDDF